MTPTISSGGRPQHIMDVLAVPLPPDSAVVRLEQGGLLVATGDIATIDLICGKCGLKVATMPGGVHWRGQSSNNAAIFHEPCGAYNALP
jgi:hypothetical protein